MTQSGDEQAIRMAERAARHSRARLVAYLAARSGDVASAEDALAEAFAAALTDWPRTGVPDAPDAWLLTVARRKLIDGARRRKTSADAEPHLRLLADEIVASESSDMAIPDQRLALMFACAHPALEPSVRTALMLQTVLGLDAATIGSAFLVPPATMSQRLVRAKTKIREAGIPFRVPEPTELPERLDAVLQAIYAAFTRGWGDIGGEDTPQRDLVREAIFLGELLAELLPGEPEALGLAALMLFAEARREARRDAAGGYVPLSEQDAGRWDVELIERAEALLRLASRLGQIGRFQLEAAVQSAHVARARTGRTDWEAIAALYGGLWELTRSPVVAINRAVAIGQWRGAAEGLVALAAAEVDPAIARYQPYWAAKAGLLAEAGDAAAADEAYGQAIGLATDPAAREFLIGRRQALRN